MAPGCLDVPGADGFIVPQPGDDGAVRAVAYHWRRECSGREVGRRRSPTRSLAPPVERLDPVAEPRAATPLVA